MATPESFGGVHKEVIPEKIRISVANLVRHIRIKETGEIHYLGILNPTAYKRGEKLYQSLGGGAEVSAGAKRDLERAGAVFPEGSMDARFVIPADKFNDVYAQFTERNDGFFEADAMRELREELCDEELPGIQPILTPEEAGQIEMMYIGPTSQMPTERIGETTPQTQDVPTRRLFHLFEIVVPQELFEKIRTSEAVHVFSAEELERGEGRIHLHASDGSEIANNLFAPDF